MKVEEDESLGGGGCKVFDFTFWEKKAKWEIGALFLSRIKVSRFLENGEMWE